MDFVKQFAGQSSNQQGQPGQQQQSGGQSGGFMDSINGALGGGAQGEAKEGP